MNRLLRLFCLPTQNPEKLDNFNEIGELLNELHSEFPSLSLDQNSDYIYYDGETHFFGRQISGPLKPKDSELIPRGRIIDLALKNQGAPTSFAAVSEVMKSDDHKPFLVSLKPHGSTLEMDYYSFEDIDL